MARLLTLLFFPLFLLKLFLFKNLILPAERRGFWKTKKTQQKTIKNRWPGYWLMMARLLTLQHIYICCSVRFWGIVLAVFVFKSGAHGCFRKWGAQLLGQINNFVTFRPYGREWLVAAGVALIRRCLWGTAWKRGSWNTHLAPLKSVSIGAHWSWQCHNAQNCGENMLCAVQNPKNSRMPKNVVPQKRKGQTFFSARAIEIFVVLLLAPRFS